MSAPYRKAMQQQLRLASKGTGWKQAQGVVFRQSDEWFIAGHWRNVSADPADGLVVRILAKPMALDPLLWETMGLEENNAKPLSFRYWGAFVCGTPALLERPLEQITPEDAMPAMIAALNAMLPELFLLLATQKFSDLARDPVGIHDNWRMGETITHALRLEDDPDLALKYARDNRGAFSVSKTVKDPVRSGKTHNQIVAAQLAPQPARSGLSKLLGRLFGR